MVAVPHNTFVWYCRQQQNDSQTTLSGSSPCRIWSWYRHSIYNYNNNVTLLYFPLRQVTVGSEVAKKISQYGTSNKHYHGQHQRLAHHGKSLQMAK